MSENDGRKLSPAAQEALRLRVVRAIVEQGMSRAEAVRVFGVGRTSIYYWLKAHGAGGERALKARKRGPRRASRLKGHEAATVVRIIEDGCPDQVKLPFALWTREAVRQLIKRRYGIVVSLTTVGRYLKRWGFTPRKPVRRAYERDEAAVERWLEEEYPAIRREAKAEKARIYWGDEMGLRSDHQAGTSYGRRGKTPVVPGTGKRFRCSTISAVANRGEMAFMVFRERFTAEVFIKFCRRLLRHRGGKVYFIVDSHPVHKARKAKAWAAKQEGRIKLFYLPGYSPELNPDELLNQDVKGNAGGRMRPTDQTEMMSNVRSYLRSTQKRPDVVKKYFDHKDVRYARDV